MSLTSYRAAPSRVSTHLNEAACISDVPEREPLSQIFFKRLKLPP